MGNNGKIRDSGIELLKILSMMMIVFAHVVQSTAMKSPLFPQYDANIADLTQVTYDPSRLILIFLWTFGWTWLGSFLVCSAWFMVDSKKFCLNKVVRMIMNVWIISVVYLIIYKFFIGEAVSLDLTVKALFPTIFSVNWYITCYVILYLIHPFLNVVINAIDQKSHLIFVLVSLFGYCTVTIVFPNLLYFTDLFVFIEYYFVVAYVKRYLHNQANSISTNLKFLLIPWLIDTIVKVGIDIAGHRINAFQDKMFMFNGMYNPLFIIMAIALFNLFRQIKFKNALINYVSSVMLWVYVIHENLMFRTFTRPRIWNWIYGKYGKEAIVIEAVCFATIIYWSAVFVACIYDKTIRPFADKLGDFVSSKIVRLFDVITEKLM